VIALDTNVLARFYIDEAEVEAKKQHVQAKRVMARPALFVARTVLLELEWVLRGGYGYAREEVATVLQHLTALPNVTVENWEIVINALDVYRSGLDFADALHLAAARYAGCEKLTTFDAKFAKVNAKLGAKPKVTLVKTEIGSI